jgi:DDE superfamily endonuclease
LIKLSIDSSIEGSIEESRINTEKENGRNIKLIRGRQKAFGHIARNFTIGPINIQIKGMPYRYIPDYIEEPAWKETVRLFIFGTIIWNGPLFKSHFGVTFSTLRMIWWHIAKYYNLHKLDYSLLPKHLLWALHFMKSYETWNVLTTYCRADKKTIQLWVWRIIELIPLSMPKVYYPRYLSIHFNVAFFFQIFQVIDWEYRKRYWRYFQPSCALDVTRTRIPKPWREGENQLMKIYWSGKDKFHALKYEVVVSLGKYVKIVYISGGWAGSKHDLTIARRSSLLQLENGEKTVCDLGYIGQDHQIITPLPNTTLANVFQNKMMSHLRQNVERMNNRIKIFRAAREWRGRRNNHWKVFHAISYITNLELEATPLNGEEPERGLIDI